MLEVGQTFPEFSLQDDNGNTVTKKDLLGQNWVIFVYPKDSTPGCTIESCSFRDYYSQFKDIDVKVFGISADNLKSHKRFIERNNLNFPLLSDPERVLLTQMGSYGEKVSFGVKRMGIIRSTFVVDKEGKVLAVWPKVKTKGHAQVVFDFIKDKIN